MVLNLGLGAIDSQSANAPRKSRKKDTTASDEERFKELLALMCKLCLSNSQQVRTLKACTMRVFIVETKCNFYTEGRKEIDRYLQAAPEYSTQEDKEANIGLIHHQLWNAFLALAEKGHSEQPESHAGKTMLSKYIAEVNGMDKALRMSMMAKEVRHIKFAKAFDKANKKLEIMILPGSKSETVFEESVLPVMKLEKGFKEKHGVAPKGNLERRLQSWLENGQMELVGSDEE